MKLVFHSWWFSYPTLRLEIPRFILHLQWSNGFLRACKMAISKGKNIDLNLQLRFCGFPERYPFNASMTWHNCHLHVQQCHCCWGRCHFLRVMAISRLGWPTKSCLVFRRAWCFDDLLLFWSSIGGEPKTKQCLHQPFGWLSFGFFAKEFAKNYQISDWWLLYFAQK